MDEIVLCDTCEKPVHEEEALKCSNCQEDLCGGCAKKVAGEIQCEKCSGEKKEPLYYILSWKWTQSGSGQFLQDDFVWYAPNACGYTKYLSKAGKYTLAEAREHEHGHGEVVVTQAIPCEEAELWAMPVVRATDQVIARFQAFKLPPVKETTNAQDPAD